MDISETFCWRISKENGWYIIGCLDLLIAIIINMAIIQCYMYGNIDELSLLCQNHGTHYSGGENLNCPPAEVNRTIMYLLAFVTFSCNFVVFMYPFSLLQAHKTKTPEILMTQIIGGIIKLMCIFVYAVLAALFLPMRALVLFFVIVFEHYKIRHSLYLYIHLKNRQNDEFLDRLRLEAEKQMAFLRVVDPPSYEEATVLSRANATPISSTEPHDTEQSIRIDVSHTTAVSAAAPPDTEQSTKIDVSNSIPLSPAAPQHTEQSTRIYVSNSIPLSPAAPQDTEQSTRIDVSNSIPDSTVAAQDTEQSTRIDAPDRIPAISPVTPQDTEQSTRIDVSNSIPDSTVAAQDIEQSTRIDAPDRIPAISPATPQDTEQSTRIDVPLSPTSAER